MSSLIRRFCVLIALSSAFAAVTPVAQASADRRDERSGQHARGGACGDHARGRAGSGGAGDHGRERAAAGGSPAGTSGQGRGQGQGQTDPYAQGGGRKVG
jgi:hypothetical protein